MEMLYPFLKYLSIHNGTKYVDQCSPICGDHNIQNTQLYVGRLVFTYHNKYVLKNVYYTRRPLLPVPHMYAYEI